ncbi:unnamed protein product [Closterium sp. NIES-64]|nr:unnamed protein product [Closterium sp. NIES-64]
MRAVLVSPVLLSLPFSSPLSFSSNNPPFSPLSPPPSPHPSLFPSHRVTAERHAFFLPHIYAMLGASLVVSTVSPFPPSLQPKCRPHSSRTAISSSTRSSSRASMQLIPAAAAAVSPFHFFRCPSPSHPTSSPIPSGRPFHQRALPPAHLCSCSPPYPPSSHPLPFLPTPSHLQPFLPDGHFINALFLPRIYAVLIPAAAAVLMLGFVLIFFAAVLMGQKTGKAKSS